MTTPRKHYSPAFKSQVVQEALEGNKTLSQIASEHAIHPNVIAKWKRAALEALPDTFDERADKQFKALIDRYEKVYLVTLVGTGGTGKTRLSLAVAEKLQLHQVGRKIADFGAPVCPRS